MIEPILQLALSNLIVSVALATLAHAVDRRDRHPAVAHALWVLVLVKVLTPPLVMLPLAPGVAQGWLAADPGPAAAGTGAAAPIAALLDQAVPVLLLAWGIGSAVVLAVSLIRVRRFDRLLHRTSQPASDDIRGTAAAVATRLDLRACPSILITSARFSPLTWWTGGHVRVVLPAALCDDIDPDELRWVIAHELAHVKRCDHLVRWLEWLACVAFWWNPVVWWARRSLRHDEEVSCDALVVARLGGRPQAYARAILTVVEFLAGTSTRPPAVATGIDAGGRLERRFARIVLPGSVTPMPRRLVAAVMTGALVLMTIGVGSASPLQTALDPRLPAGAVRPPVAGGGDNAASEPGNVVVDPLGEALVRTQEADGYAPLSAEIIGVHAAPGRGARTRARDTHAIGASSRDVLIGDTGADVLRGHRGHDRLLGGSGGDHLFGGRGADELLGGPGADTIRAGAGADIVTGGRGADTIHGGSGDDLIRTRQDASADVIDCGPGDADRAIVDAADTATGCEIVVIR